MLTRWPAGTSADCDIWQSASSSSDRANNARRIRSLPFWSYMKQQIEYVDCRDGYSIINNQRHWI